VSFGRHGFKPPFCVPVSKVGKETPIWIRPVFDPEQKKQTNVFVDKTAIRLSSQRSLPVQGDAGHPG
jgi:hypothetical protein